MSSAIYGQLVLDAAWEVSEIAGAEVLDLSSMGREVRYASTRKAFDELRQSLQEWSPRYNLLGSGDFHHVTTLLLENLAEKVTLVSFDNHPDWDTRFPFYGCGTWVNRALALPQVERAVIWGCGNFELEPPTLLFANHRALSFGELQVFPWEERLSLRGRKRWQAIRRESWRSAFSQFAEQLSGRQLYITLDLDCLKETEATTNWEQGLFTIDDLCWALDELHRNAQVCGGDICGAYSPSEYARPFQRLCAWWDHPKLPPVSLAEARSRNRLALQRLWPALTGRDKRHACRDEADTQPELRSRALL